MKVSLASGKDPSLRWKFIHIGNFLPQKPGNRLLLNEKKFHGVDFTLNLLLTAGKFDTRNFNNFKDALLAQFS